MNLNDLYTQIDTASCQFSSVNTRGGKYEAAYGSERMLTPSPFLREEDRVLRQRERDRIESSNLDLQRNSAIAGWQVRKHLDFVSTFNFDCLSDWPSLDEEIEGLIAEWSTKDEFDIRGRLGLQDHIRLDEAARTIRGDMLIQKLDNGKVQAIEADRIRNPDTRKFRGDWKNGCLQNKAGRITHYSIHKRTDNGFKFERVLRANRAFHFGYYIRHDQRRGISPTTSALNLLRRVHNSVKFAQAKQMMSQILGLQVQKHDPKYGDVDFTDGPFMIETKIGETVDLITDKTPSKEFDHFLRHVISMILKSLDLPYNFYDESHTNFFGSRAALNLYLMSCLAKRRGVRELLNHLTLWRLNFELSRGRLTLPRGVDLNRFYRKHCEWIPIGVQWWNPLQEAKAAEKLLELRLTTRSEIRKQTHGDSWYSLADRYDREEIRLANAMYSQGNPDGNTPNQDSLVEEIIDGVVARLQEMGLAA